MSSSDKTPGPMPPGDGSVPPGKLMTMGQQMLDKGAQMMQSLKPIKKMSQHVCTFALYSHDMTRQIETHHYVTRISQDFLQCAVYDSDDSAGRLIGVEYIVSDKIFETLPPEEQKLWHSHAYEISSGLWVNPRVPEMIQRIELQDLARTYGKFWCTWQVDRVPHRNNSGLQRWSTLPEYLTGVPRCLFVDVDNAHLPKVCSGDKLPLGAPALMMSPQGVNVGAIKPELVQKRDEKYKIPTDDLRMSRISIEVPELIHPNADYWKETGKGFAIDMEQTEMKS